MGLFFLPAVTSDDRLAGSPRSCNSAAQLKRCSCTCTPICYTIYVLPGRLCCQFFQVLLQQDGTALLPPSESRVCRSLFSPHPSMVSHQFGSLGVSQISIIYEIPGVLARKFLGSARTKCCTCTYQNLVRSRLIYCVQLNK
jgi:hypothetical protein